MDIKEIALKHSREYLTFKLGGRKGLDVAEIVCDDEIYAEIVDELAQQFESIIESYKAELLKGVGEPVAWMWRRHALAKWEVVPRWDEIESMAAKGMEEREWEVVRFFTSHQVAAAVVKAEQRIAEWQPIETAPKDGTVIMVAEETEPGFWEYEQGFYSQTWGFGGGSCTNNPTHWMPLPTQPSEGGK